MSHCLRHMHRCRFQRWWHTSKQADKRGQLYHVYSVKRDLDHFICLSEKQSERYNRTHTGCQNYRYHKCTTSFYLNSTNWCWCQNGLQLSVPDGSIADFYFFKQHTQDASARKGCNYGFLVAQLQFVLNLKQHTHDTGSRKGFNYGYLMAILQHCNTTYRLKWKVWNYFWQGKLSGVALRSRPYPSCSPHLMFVLWWTATHQFCTHLVTTRLDLITCRRPTLLTPCTSAHCTIK